MMSGFNKEKGVEDLKIDQNYIVTIFWRWGTYFIGKNLCNSGLMILAWN